MTLILLKVLFFIHLFTFLFFFFRSWKKKGDFVISLPECLDSWGKKKKREEKKRRALRVNWLMLLTLVWKRSTETKNKKTNYSQTKQTGGSWCSSDSQCKNKWTGNKIKKNGRMERTCGVLWWCNCGRGTAPLTIYIASASPVLVLSVTLQQPLLTEGRRVPSAPEWSI